MINPKRFAICIWVLILLVGLANIFVSVKMSDTGLRLKDNQIEQETIKKEIVSLQQQRTRNASLTTITNNAVESGFTSDAAIARLHEAADIAMNR